MRLAPYCFLGLLQLLFAVQMYAAGPCAVVDYRIATKRQIQVSCDDTSAQITPRVVTVTEMSDSGDRTATKITGHLAQDPDTDWLVLSLDSDLLGGKSYLVEAEDKASAFDAYTLSTKPTATVSLVNSSQKTDCSGTSNDRRLNVQSKVAYDSSFLDGKLTIQDGATYPVSLRPSHTSGPRATGLVLACVKSYATGAGQVQTFTVVGLKNILGDAVKATGTDTSGKAPADKASSTYYIKLDAQAGQGQKPGYTIQATLAPSLRNLGAGWYLTPNADIDVGFAKSDNAKTTTDMLKFGIGASRYFSRERIEFQPSLQYETDRHGDHRNLLFDGEAKIFGNRWRGSIAERNYDEYIRRLEDDPLRRSDIDIRPVPKSATEVNVYHWGYLFELTAGTEVGRALTSDTANSSDKKTSVVVATYNIARFKPTLSFTGEYRRVSISLQAVPRYLFPNESVTREVAVPDSTDPTKTFQNIYLRSLSGWHVLGTTTFLWKLDPAGHYSWTITHKMGSLPPNFDHVNQVETGLVVIF